MAEMALRPMADPQAKLEEQFIDQYLLFVRQDPVAIRKSSQADAKKILASAAEYASGRLAEQSCRANYVNALHIRF